MKARSVFPALSMLMTSSFVAGLDNPDGGYMSFDAKQVFDVNLDEGITSGPLSKGSCAKWKDTIEYGYLEAFQMIHAGWEKAKLYDEPEPAQMTTEWFTWNIAVQPFWLALAKHEDPKYKKSIKEHAQETYRFMFAWHQKQDSERDHNAQRYLRCDDDFLEPLGPEDKDPRDKGTPHEGKYTLAKPRRGNAPYPKGAYYVESFKPEDSLFDRRDFASDTDHPICVRPQAGRVEGESIYAEVLLGRRLLVLCPTLLDNPDWSVNDLKEKITPGETEISAFDHTLAKVLIHEMGHYACKWEDFIATDTQGQDLPVEKRTGRPPGVWGWNAAWLLARYRPEDTLSSPENIAYYALMAYLDKFYWGTGRASKEPAPEERLAPFLRSPIEQEEWKRKQAGKASGSTPQGSSEKGGGKDSKGGGKGGKGFLKGILKKPGQSSSRPHGRSFARQIDSQGNVTESNALE